MPKITAEVPGKIYKNIAEEVKLGIFSNASEAIKSALKKAYAGESRISGKWDAASVAVEIVYQREALTLKRRC